MEINSEMIMDMYNNGNYFDLVFENILENYMSQMCIRIIRNCMDEDDRAMINVVEKITNQLQLDKIDTDDYDEVYDNIEEINDKIKTARALMVIFNR